ncbi:hypothetical protein CLU79DRAFT_750076 [Phycomyces nitens]|nr:hypothetical protein CLU79DRAFT_750076 [Phycomyces nitens]
MLIKYAVPLSLIYLCSTKYRYLYKSSFFFQTHFIFLGCVVAKYTHNTYHSQEQLDYSFF